MQVNLRVPVRLVAAAGASIMNASHTRAAGPWCHFSVGGRQKRERSVHRFGLQVRGAGRDRQPGRRLPLRKSRIEGSPLGLRGSMLIYGFGYFSKSAHPMSPRKPMMICRAVRRMAVFALLAAGLCGFGDGSALAQMLQHGMGQGMHGHGADGAGHDEANMTGLRGLNATPEETAELTVMFRGLRSFSREVVDLPNGIRTKTTSSDDAVTKALVSHVVGMIGRVEAGDDPRIMIQSPTLDIFFARGDTIVTEIEVLDDGVVVVQTSEDPEMVEALHVHAAEVSDMADRGMQAVHEMMMRSDGN